MLGRASWKEGALASDLTLAAGKRLAAFRKLDVRGGIRRHAEMLKQERTTLDDYPDLKKMEGQASFVEHPDWPEYAALLEIRMHYWPWLTAAWAGDGALTLDDVLSSGTDEMHACMGTVLRLNEDLRILFPPIIVRNYPPETRDPNA